MQECCGKSAYFGIFLTVFTVSLLYRKKSLYWYLSDANITLYQCHAQTYSKLCKCISEQFANTSGLPIQKNVYSIFCYS